MKMKKTVTFFFFLIAGVIVGALIASLAESVPLLSWLSYGQSIGIPLSSPVVLDLAIIKFSFACQMGINVAQIITITMALFFYRHVAQKL